MKSERDVLSDMKCIRLAMLCFILAGVIACATPLVHTGYLNDYEALQPVQGADTSVWYAQWKPDLTVPHVLYIAPVSYVAPPVIPPSLEREIAMLMRERLYIHALRAFAPRLIITKTEETDKYTEIGYTVDTLSVAVTHVTRGNGLLRYVIGYGLGAATLQAEGVLRNAQTEEHLLHFAVRISHGGNPSMGFNPRAMSSRHCLRLAADAAAHQIIRSLAKLWALPQQELPD
jgi:hypothetical protein